MEVKVGVEVRYQWYTKGNRRGERLLSERLEFEMDKKCVETDFVSSIASMVDKKTHAVCVLDDGEQGMFLPLVHVSTEGSRVGNVRRAESSTHD